MLAMGLTACSGGKADDNVAQKDARAVLADAAEKTAVQNSYRTRQSGSSDGSVAEMAWQRKPFFSSTNIHGKKTEDNPSGETYLVGTAEGAFTKTDKIPGKEWFRIEPSSGKGDKEADRSRSRGLLTELLGALNATGDAKWVRAEKVHGRPTDHFQGTVVLAELAKYQGPAMDKDVHDWYVGTLQKSGKKQAVIDIWVGRDGLVVKAQEVSSGDKGQERITEEYRDYGADLKGEVPPANEVASFDEYIQALAKRPSA